MCLNFFSYKHIIYTTAICIYPLIYNNLNFIPIIYANSKIINKRSKVNYDKFINYASYYYEGEYYITPNNFINILLNISPQANEKVKTIDKIDVNTINNNYKNVENVVKTFNFVGADGILSFTEYEFLRFMMKKSLSKIDLLFKLMDKNKNQKLDREEFVQVENVLIKSSASQTNEESTGDESDVINTSLLTYFFGPNGNHSLSFQQFSSFIENMRQEVWRTEFNLVSLGKDTFTAVDFALLLFKQAQLPPLVLKEYIDRIKLQIPFNTEVSWEEYKQLCTFFTYLDDFSAILNIHSIASYDISQKEFKRAVYLSSGVSLSHRLCDILFAIFDQNCDGFINHPEFVRLVRRSRRYGPASTFATTRSSVNQDQVAISRGMSNWYHNFKNCVSQNIRYY